MESSELKYPVTVKVYPDKSVYDDVGNDITEFVPLIKCRAKINGAGGREYYSASTINSENDLTFEIRYCKSLSKLKPQTTQIVYNGDVYDVKQIDDYMQSHEYLKIRAVCVNGK